jgi:catechol 2,3-dioxygenase-like lactoylglutathione lyase family enzyme
MAAKLTKPALDVGLVTSNAPLALQFYRDLLGFTEDGEVRFPGLGLIRRLRCGESIFRILEMERAPAATASTAGFAAQTGLRYITLTVSNLQEIVDAASAAGFPVPVPPRTLCPGVSVAQIEDGQGTAVELMQIDA